MLEISTEFDLQASHQLAHLPDNHKCAQLHGHTWTIRVWVTGKLDPEKGWILDYADLRDIWMREVHAQLDHRHLNEPVPIPTTENLAGWIYARMQTALTPLGCTVTEIEISEGRVHRTRLRPDVSHQQPR